MGNNVLPKILVILSQILSWGQILLIPMDLGLQGVLDDNNFEVVYQVIFPIILGLVCFINPLAIFLYESDPNDSGCARGVWSILYAFIVAAIWCGFVFISYIWLGRFDIGGVDERIHVSIYVMLCLSLAGWLFLTVHGAIGLVFLPFDLLMYFFSKPEPLTTEQAYAKKRRLQ